jgi:predicted RNase H-like HicB family nuclease
MNTIADQYEKIVYWSDEDQCYIGMCPELFYGGVYGDDPETVFKELLEVVDEWVEIFEKDVRALPEPKHAVEQAA